MSGFPVKPALDLGEIEWRAEGKPFARGSGHQCLWVAYLQAPTVAGLFDAWIGEDNWTDTYVVREFSPKGTDVVQAIECTLSCRVPGSDQWISKTDVGEFSNWAAVKGGYSDAFKRAGILKWGLGRVIYALPQVWAECRTYGSGDNLKIGGETRDTQNTIESTLKRNGFTGASARVSASSFEGDDEHGESPAATHRPAVPSVSSPAGSGEVSAPVAASGGSEAAGGSSGVVGDAPLSVIEAWNALSAGKSLAMKELKGEGLWPIAELDGVDADAAIALIGRFAEAEVAAS